MSCSPSNQGLLPGGGSARFWDYRAAHRAGGDCGDVENIHQSRPAWLGQHHPDLQSLHLVQDRWPAMVVDSVAIHLVNFIVAIILCIDLAKSFGKGAGFGIGIALLGVIFLPILGFGSAHYQGPAAAQVAAGSRATSAARIVPPIKRADWKHAPSLT